MEIKWEETSKEGNYVAATSYLSLIFSPAEVFHLITALKKAPVTEFCAKDVFRASGLPLLGISNHRITVDKKKIETGEKLSPILLVRQPTFGKVVIADGYHRMCALYYFDEKAMVKCKIV